MKVFGSNTSGDHFLDRPSVYGIFQRKSGEIALIEVTGRHYLPGGGIEGDETHHECLQRECLEEIGWQISIGSFLEETLSFIRRLHDGARFKILGYYYQITNFIQSSAPIELNHQLVWKPPEFAANHLISEAQRYILQKYFYTQ